MVSGVADAGGVVAGARYRSSVAIMADGDLEHVDELATEVELAGGNVTPVRRRGDTVLRAGGVWTPSVHAVLERAIAAGMNGVPRPLGVCADGREILTFLPGAVPAYPMPSWVWGDDVLVQAARMLRRWHDATAGFSVPDARWRLPSHEPAEVICHNDFAQYNLVFDLDADQPSLVGVIDFDTMSPGPRVWDIAYLAYRLVPFLDERGAPGPEARSDRLERLLQAYGADATPAEVIATMAVRLRELADFTDQRAEESGRADLRDHAAMYRDHAQRLSAGAR